MNELSSFGPQHPLLVLHCDQLSTAFGQSLLKECQNHVIQAVGHRLRMQALEDLSRDLTSRACADYSAALREGYHEAAAQQQQPTLFVLRCSSDKVQGVLAACAGAQVMAEAVLCPLPSLWQMPAASQQGHQDSAFAAPSISDPGELATIAPNMTAAVCFAMREFLRQLSEVAHHGPSPLPLPIPDSVGSRTQPSLASVMQPSSSPGKDVMGVTSSDSAGPSAVLDIHPQVDRHTATSTGIGGSPTTGRHSDSDPPGKRSGSSVRKLFSFRSSKI